MKKIIFVLVVLILSGTLNSIHAQNIKGKILTEAMTNKIWVNHLKKDSIVVSTVPYSYARVVLLDSSRQILHIVYTDTEGKYMFENAGKGKGKYIIQVTKKRGEEDVPVYEKNIWVRYDMNYLKPIVIR